MKSVQKPALVIVSVQVQTSFQAVPLGGACVVSSLKADPRVNDLAAVSLADFSLEDPAFSGLSPSAAGALIAERLAPLFCSSSGETPGSDSASTSGGAPSPAPSVPPLAGFSVYVWNRPVLEAASSRLRALVPGIVIFAGGPEVTASPGSFSSADELRITSIPGVLVSRSPIPNGRYTGEAGDFFDYLVETATRSLAAALLSLNPPAPAAVYPGSRAPAEDWASLPSPWLDGTLDGCPSVRECRGALWELARGCPYKCAYCYESKGDKKVRSFPLARLEKELDHFVKSGTERIFVLDPTYNASRDRALDLLRLIEKKAPEIHFNFEVRAEHLDRELVAAFGRIPCSLQIGLQSTNQEALRAVNRPCDISVFTKKIGLLNDAGIVFGLDLMYGLPGDSLSGFRSSVDYAIGLYPNNLEIFRLAVLPGTDLAERADSLAVRALSEPPYHVLSTPKFSAQDLSRAAEIARACDVFYTQGRAVTWFLSMLHPLKLKASQFFQDFARFIADPAVVKRFPELAAGDTATPGASVAPGPCEFSQARAERLQLEFLSVKFAEKEKAFLLPALCDVIALNGAWTRALAEGEETVLSLSYHPEDLLSPDAMDLEYFTENAYMENCTVRVFAGTDGPDMEIS